MTKLETHQIAGVCSVHRPARSVPLIFDSPHSGTEFPQDFRPALDHTLVLRTADLHVGKIFQPVTEAGASLLEAHFPRAYIDVNRAIDDLDQTLLQSPWPEPLRPSEKSELGKGLIWRVAAGGRPIHARRLSVAEARNRIEGYYLPYHNQLSSLVDDMHREFGQVWHINCHSMKSMSTAMDAEGAGIARSDIVLSDREGLSASSDLVQFVRQELGGHGLKVAINDPFKGAEIIKKHGKPALGKHSIQVEINRALYMNERTLQTDAGFAMIQNTMKSLSIALAAYYRSQI